MGFHMSARPSDLDTMTITARRATKWIAKNSKLHKMRARVACICNHKLLDHEKHNNFPRLQKYLLTENKTVSTVMHKIHDKKAHQVVWIGETLRRSSF